MIKFIKEIWAEFGPNEKKYVSFMLSAIVICLILIVVFP